MALFRKQMAPVENGKAPAEPSVRDLIAGYGQLCDKNIATMAAMLALGVDPNGISKFGKLLSMIPDNQNVNVNYRTNGGWTKALLVAAIVLLATLLLLSGWWLLGRSAAGMPATSQVPTPAAPAVIAPDGFIKFEQLQPDGSYVFISSMPAKALPDGRAQSIDGRIWRKGANGWVEDASPK